MVNTLVQSYRELTLEGCSDPQPLKKTYIYNIHTLVFRDPNRKTWPQASDKVLTACLGWIS